MVYAEIELINGEDLALSRRHYIKNEEIRRIKVSALVDKIWYMLAINERLQQQMQFTLLEKRKVRIATGEILSFDVVGPVELRFKNRQTTCRAMVLPGDAEVLLGKIPLDDMDVLIHPQRQELIVNTDHPYFAHIKMKPLALISVH